MYLLFLLFASVSANCVSNDDCDVKNHSCIQGNCHPTIVQPGGFCINHLQCSLYDKHLSCYQSKCVCIAENQLYVNLLEKCTTNGCNDETDCSVGKYCGRNFTCVDFPFRKPGESCSAEFQCSEFDSNSRCVDGFCECTAPLETVSGHRCNRTRFGCDRHADCPERFPFCHRGLCHLNPVCRDHTPPPPDDNCYQSLVGCISVSIVLMLCLIPSLYWCVKKLPRNVIHEWRRCCLVCHRCRSPQEEIFPLDPFEQNLQNLEHQFEAQARRPLPPIPSVSNLVEDIEDEHIYVNDDQMQSHDYDLATENEMQLAAAINFEYEAREDETGAEAGATAEGIYMTTEEFEVLEKNREIAMMAKKESRNSEKDAEKPEASGEYMTTEEVEEMGEIEKTAEKESGQEENVNDEKEE